MADETKRSDQFGEQSDATSGGGASTSRDGRDAGMPGPAPETVTGRSKPYAGTEESTGDGGDAQPRGRADEPGTGKPAAGPAPGTA